MYTSDVQPAPVAQLCGIIITIWQSLMIPDLLNAAICAATGTLVSFITTVALKKIFMHKKQRSRIRARRGKSV